MYLYIGYINEATNFAERQGDGDGDAKDWGHTKDEDEIEWIRRCLRQATRMSKPRNGKGIRRRTIRCEKSYIGFSHLIEYMNNVTKRNTHQFFFYSKQQPHHVPL